MPNERHALRRRYAWVLSLGMVLTGCARLAAEDDAGNPPRPRPSPRQAAERVAGHGHDLGTGRLSGARHRSGRLRRTPLASVPPRPRLPEAVPGRPAGLLLPLRHRRAA